MEQATATIKELRWVRRMNPPNFVNSTAISGNGDRVIAGTFYYPYSAAELPMQFGTFCFDGAGKQLWSDVAEGAEGVYCVAISPDGAIAASGGRMEAVDGFIHAYDVESGKLLANYSTGSRTNQLALSKGRAVLAAGSDQIYLAQSVKGAFPQNASSYPVNPVANNNVQSVSMPVDGTWFVAGDYAGTVYLVENDSGSIGKVYTSAAGLLGTVHCVAAAGDGSWFIAVGGSPDVYVFSPESIQQGNYVTKFSLPTAGRVGWAAISFEGDMISVVQNNGKAGIVYYLQNQNGTLTQLWSQNTLSNPNSTSLDASGEHVTVADGYTPNGNVGHFYLFDGTSGNLLWSFQTPEMNWPMFISTLGTGIAAGSDYGDVYYFTPE